VIFIIASTFPKGLYLRRNFIEPAHSQDGNDRAAKGVGQNSDFVSATCVLLPTLIENSSKKSGTDLRTRVYLSETPAVAAVKPTLFNRGPHRARPLVKPGPIARINRPLPQAVLTPSKVPRCSRVATLADGEVVAAKRALPVVASQAALSATGRMMVKRLRRRNLFSLRHSRPDLVTFGARYLLMFRMIKADSERLGRFRRPGITAQLVTRPTRRDVATAGLRARRVTLIAGYVRVKS
jgi:hypothetical protein